jgi:predicted ribosomally synthesized peptide with nif11-like leader
MNQNEMQKQIKKLLETPEFSDKLSQCETYDEIATLFSNEGIEVTGDELESAMAQVSAQSENGELSEESMEQVAGGFLSVASAALIATIVINGAPYAWKLGQVLGQAVSKKIIKK